MKFKYLLIATLLCSVLADKANSRIRMRKVKESPKVCSVMDEDKYLSRPDRRVFGTLRNSVILDENISIVSDLGKKICLWSYDKWLPLGDLTKYTYYIDEQRNFLYPYTKIADKYQVAKINLDSCEIDELETLDKLDLPKCERKKSKKIKSKRKVAGSSKTKKKSVRK